MVGHDFILHWRGLAADRGDLARMGPSPPPGAHVRSRERPDAGAHLVGQVSLTWMHEWWGGMPFHLEAVVATTGVEWSISRSVTRAEHRLVAPVPRTGGAAAMAADHDLDECLHLATSNRGVLLTPVPTMALMAPETTDGAPIGHPSSPRR